MDDSTFRLKSDSEDSTTTFEDLPDVGVSTQGDVTPQDTPAVELNKQPEGATKTTICQRRRKHSSPEKQASPKKKLKKERSQTKQPAKANRSKSSAPAGSCSCRFEYVKGEDTGDDDIWKLCEQMLVLKVDIQTAKRPETKNENSARKCAYRICALANSGGGILSVLNTNPSVRYPDLDKWSQRISEGLRVLWASIPEIPIHLIYSRYHRFGMTFFVKGSQECHIPRDCFHLKIRLLSSVTDIRSYSELKMVLHRDSQEVASGSRQQEPLHFVHNECIHNNAELLGEGSVEFKEVSIQNKSESVPIANRIANELPKYVSAFANTFGGTIYFGITDSAICVGVKLSDEQRKEITTEVTEKLKAMHCVFTNSKETLDKIRPEFHDVSQQKFPLGDGSANSESASAKLYVVSVTVPELTGGVCTTKPNRPTTRMPELKSDTTSLECLYENETVEIEDLFPPTTTASAARKAEDFNSKFESLSLRSRSTACWTLKDERKSLMESHFELKVGFPTNIVNGVFGDEITNFVSNLKELYPNDKGRVFASHSLSRDMGESFNDFEMPIVCDLLVISERWGFVLITVFDTLTNEEKTKLYNRWTGTKLRNKLWDLNCDLNMIILPHTVLLKNLQYDTLESAIELQKVYPEQWLPTSKQIDKVLETLPVLFASFASPLSLAVGSTFLHLLTKKQYEILRDYHYAPEVYVKGVAGSGKTVIAIERIKRLLHSEVKPESICYVCENCALAAFVRKAFSTSAGELRICVQTRMRYQRYVGGNDSVLGRTHHFIFDEAQQYRVEESSVNWLTGARRVLSKNKESIRSDGRSRSLWILYDPEQCCHNQENTGIPPENEMRKDGFFIELERVIRNSKKITNESNKYREKKMQTAHNYVGCDVENESRTGKPIARCIRELLLSNIAPSQIAILAANEETATELRQQLKTEIEQDVSIPTQVLLNAENGVSQQGIVVDSVGRFSGLERDVVILVDIRSGYKARMLCGVSRAMQRLIIYKSKRTTSKHPS